MKCKYCNGTGATNWYVNRAFVTCPYCGGTGEMEGNMTNEEWLEQARTEEKAKLLSKLVKFVYNCGKKGSIPKFMYEEDFVQWLKEKYHE